MATLNAADIDQQLAALDGWERVDQAIRKQFTFQDFPEAVLFVSALVPGAEEADHHPGHQIHYKRVTLTYTTHSEGGLTQKDFDGARAADDVAEQVPHLRSSATDKARRSHRRRAPVETARRRGICSYGAKRRLLPSAARPCLNEAEEALQLA